MENLPSFQEKKRTPIKKNELNFFSSAEAENNFFSSPEAEKLPSLRRVTKNQVEMAWGHPAAGDRGVDGRKEFYIWCDQFN